MTCPSWSPYLLYSRPYRIFISLYRNSPQLGPVSIFTTVQMHFNSFSVLYLGSQKARVKYAKLTMRPQYHIPIPYFQFVLAALEHSVHEHHDGQLIPAALDSLSPHHSAVFLFGCQVMQLLANCPLFPSVLLLPAKSIPVSLSSSNDALLAHCSGDFYFDTTNQILYLSEAKLQHVGHFIAIILQSMAYIASGNRTVVTVEC